MYLSVRGQIHFIYFNAVKVNTLWKAADVKITGIKSDTCRMFGDKKNKKQIIKNNLNVQNFPEYFAFATLLQYFCNTLLF